MEPPETTISRILAGLIFYILPITLLDLAQGRPMQDRQLLPPYWPTRLLPGKRPLCSMEVLTFPCSGMPSRFPLMLTSQKVTSCCCLSQQWVLPGLLPPLI